MLGATDALIEKRGRPAAGSPPQVHARVWALCGAPVFTGCMWPPGAMTAVAKTVGRRQQPYKSHGGASSRVLPGKAMFATLSGRSGRPRGCLEIECLFERTMRPQTDTRFSQPPKTRMR